MNEKMNFNGYIPYLNTLKKFLHSVQDSAHPCDVCVVGSLALARLGMDAVVQPHDIDIEMVCDDAMEARLRLLAESQGSVFHTVTAGASYPRDAERYMERVTWKHKPYIFRWDGTLINVWAVSAISHRYIQDSEGLKWAVVGSVLDRKCAYRRVKDYAFIQSVVKWLIGFMEKQPTTNKIDNSNEKK